VLGTIPLAVIARQTRSAMLEVLGEDYVRTARAKGLEPPRRRRACLPQRADSGRHHDRPPGRLLMAGAVLTETIFSWPGIGKWMIDSIIQARLRLGQSGCCSSR
jgi:dipeptide transport system permease protein